MPCASAFTMNSAARSIHGSSWVTDRGEPVIITAS